MNISVFTTGPSCQKCRLTKKRLDSLGLPYTEVRADLNEAVAGTLRRLAEAGDVGQIMPVVHEVENDVFFSDFHPDRLDALAALSSPESDDPGVQDGVCPAA